jgi:hypothetical protein
VPPCSDGQSPACVVARTTALALVGEFLDAMVAVPENALQSPMDRLRPEPVLQSAPELARTIKHLDEVRELAKGLPRTDKLPNESLTPRGLPMPRKRKRSLRILDERRAATLLVFIAFEVSTQDDVLDLLDVIVTENLSIRRSKGRAAWLRGWLDLDAARA